MWRNICAAWVAILLGHSGATALADDKKPGVAEVEGVVIEVYATRDGQFSRMGTSFGSEIEIVVRPKDQKKPISAWFDTSPALLNSDGTPLQGTEKTPTERLGSRGRVPQLRGIPDENSRALHFRHMVLPMGRKPFPDAAKVIPKVKGDVLIAESGWRRFEFSGANFKPNAVATANGIEAKLVIIDVEEGVADLGVRFDDSSRGQSSRSGNASPATLVVKFDDGKSQPLEQRLAANYGGADGKYFSMLRFRGAVPPNAKLVSAILSAESSAVGLGRRIGFEVVDVPIRDK